MLIILTITASTDYSIIT